MSLLITSQENSLREEICRVGQSLFARGYVHSTAGNISVQLAPEDGGGFLITPTDAALGFLEPQRLAKIDDAGRQISGDRASKTIVLHRSIYQANQAAGRATRAVIHTHSTHCVACTLNIRGPDDMGPYLLPALTPYFVMKVGHVPIVDYRRPGDPSVADIVADTIKAHAEKGLFLRAVMLDRLGPNVWHDSPSAAMSLLEELEETAKLWIASGRSAKVLDEAEINDLRDNFGACW